MRAMTNQSALPAFALAISERDDTLRADQCMKFPRDGALLMQRSFIYVYIKISVQYIDATMGFYAGLLYTT